MTEQAAGIFGLSAGLSLLVIISGIIWWALCIILFFKVWGMTNNVSRVRDILEEWIDIEHPVVEKGSETQKDTTQTSKNS